MIEKKRSVFINLDLSASLPPPIFLGIKPARLTSIGTDLTRNDKATLELSIANEFLKAISKLKIQKINNVRSNFPNDPPDIWFELDGKIIGLEITELTPINRLETENILRQIKKEVLSSITINKKMKDWVISIGLNTDNSTKIFARGLSKQLVSVIMDFFSSPDLPVDQITIKKIPKDRGTLQFYKSDLSNEPLPIEENAPLISFSGLNTIFYPDTDIPKIVEGRLREKFLHRLPDPTWLLLWSEHASLASFDEAIIQAINQYRMSHHHDYAKIIYRSLPNRNYYIFF